MKEEGYFKRNPLIKNATAHFQGISGIPRSTLCTLNIFTIKGYARKEDDSSHFSGDNTEPRFFPKNIMEKKNHTHIFSAVIWHSSSLCISR